MDPKYLIWLGVPLVGGLLGLFIRPKTLAWICAVFFGLAVVGIAVGYQTGHENTGFAFGVAAMAIPVLGALLLGGAAISRAIFKRDTPKGRVDDAV